jgi:hypothetical protein
VRILQKNEVGLWQDHLSAHQEKDIRKQK